MKIDQDYLKSLLDAFEEAPGPVTDIQQLRASGLDYRTDAFVFHAEILADQGFLTRDDRKAGIGIQRGADGSIQWSVLPLRLTAAGHEFAENLRNKEVWATIKTSFKDASISTLASVAKQLAEGYAKQKVERLLGLGAP